MIRKRKKIACPKVESSLIVNFMIFIILHLPLQGCQLRCYFFNEYNYLQFLGQMKGKYYPNVEDFLDRQIGMEPFVIDWAKEEAKNGEESFVIFMFIANNSIFKPII